MNMELVRDKFNVNVGINEDARENFQIKVSITVGNITTSMPCISEQEYEIMVNKLNEYLKYIKK